MKRYAVAFAFIVSLLSAAAVGFPGCGKGNTIVSITVTPAAPFIAKGTALLLSVNAYFSDGKYLTSWTQVTWQSSNTLVATVNSTGLVSAVSEGTAVITAIDKAHPSITCSVTVSITDLQTITIAPSLVSIPVGTVQPFTATGIYSLATPTTAPTDLTALVSWATSSTAIAVISNATGSNGIATAVSAGTTTITATDPATGLTSAVTATLTVF